ncbi:MAG TPA: ergothioneine biosynthesis protein EgtB [Candidatus Binatia bacterium]|jgi:iron(II)-dependent oxidoreductase
MSGPLQSAHRVGRVAASQADLVREAFARSVIRGLGDRPRWLSCRYLYDHRGSEIFEHITEQREYYPTRTEAGILAREAQRIRAVCGATTLVELGAGSATKTRHLLDAWTAGPHPRPVARYVPIDISRTMLAATCEALRAEFPALAVTPLAGSYEQALPRLRRFSPVTLLFLGSSIGNLNPDELGEFFTMLTANLADRDQLLLGIDLVKDTRVLEAAYNDADGWSAAFTLNLFSRMNRELGTEVDVASLEHVARWNEEKSRIDIFARALRPVVVTLPRWKRQFRIEAGEEVLVEISRKFRTEQMIADAMRHGFGHVETFTDPDCLFALLLLRYRAHADRPARLRERLRTELQEQRERTLEIVAPLTPAGLTSQHSPILSPVVWDLGHIASYEQEWVYRTASRRGTADVPAYDAGIYDPIRHPRRVRGSLALSSGAQCLSDLEAARDATLALLDSAPLTSEDPLLRDGYVFSMIAQHEAQHGETILQGIQLTNFPQYEPSRRIETQPPACAAGSGEEVLIAAGPFTMGSDDRSAAYDNERPCHIVDLPSFWIDAHPVTNEVFARFVEDGGYRRREMWTTEGWQWLRESGANHPAGWRREGDGNWSELAFGRRAPLVADRPVVHVCWYEAVACARWLGRRLPSEAEWEKAAAWDLERGVARLYPWGDSEPSPHRANLDQRTFAPAAVGAYPQGRSYYGCGQMLGDVWEWTASDFLPYPGFRAFPYPEYSQVHFGSAHKVLRGGSWATASIAIRNTFRNWDLPQRRQIFAGFRCAHD